MAVTKDEIVGAALALLDEAGLEGLTLRRLAARLGIAAPTLYWHVRDKRELLDLLVSAIMDEGLARWREPHPGQQWWDWLAGRARALRAALLAHRDSALMLAGNRPTRQDLPGIERQLEALTDAGFTPPDAVLALLALNAYVIGEALDTQGETGRADPGQSPPDDDSLPLLRSATGDLEPFGSSDQRFEYGLDLMITGLRARRDRRGPGRLEPGPLGHGRLDHGRLGHG